MKIKKQEAINQLFKKYGKYGVSKKQIKEIINDGLKHGFSLQAAIVGARWSLSMACSEHEYFTIEDICAATGETREEVIKGIKQLEREGHNVLHKGPLPA